MIQESVLSGEIGIVWEEDISELDYVREGVAWTTRPKGPIAMPGHRRVGYAETVRPPGIRGIRTYGRRVFWLNQNDRALDPIGVYSKLAPAEAIDPRTVKAGVAGVRTDRVCLITEEDV